MFLFVIVSLWGLLGLWCFVWSSKMFCGVDLCWSVG